MSKKEILEIRVTFKEEQRKLYDYIKNHSSYAGFLKDLAYREMLKDEAYINNSISNNTNAYNYSPVNHQINPYPISYTIPQNIDPSLYNQNVNVASNKDNINSKDKTNNSNNEDSKKKNSRKIKINVSDLGL